MVLELAGSSLEKVVKVAIFISAEKDFEGLNTVYREYFTKDFPARRAIIAPLVGGFKVEIDLHRAGIGMASYAMTLRAQKAAIHGSVR